MPHRDWDASYTSGNDLPWNTGVPDEHLVELVRSKRIQPGRALEVGCGTGTNCIYLAEKGFEVTGVDVAPTAVDMAKEKAEAAGSSCHFEALDFLEHDVAGGPFDFVFDRGCLHTLYEADDRSRFAERVAQLLDTGGMWASLIGSTEGGERDHGPPQRTARDVINAIEPHLEIVELRSTHFTINSESAPAAWLCLSRKRKTPAQPSTPLDPSAHP